MTEVLKPLFQKTLTRPRAAGESVISMNLPPQALWMTLTLISVSASLAVSAMMQLMPLPNDEFGELMRQSLPYSAPIIFALANWGNAVLTVFILFWVGRMFGGKGRFRDVLAVIVMLQGTAIILLVALMLASLVVPFLSSLLLLALAAWVVWATVSLIDVAHDFDNVMRALGTFLVAALGVPLGLTIFTGVLVALTAGG